MRAMDPQPKMAFVYPGQGAVPERPPGELFAGFPSVRELYDAVSVPGCPDFDGFHQGGALTDLRAQLGVYALSWALGEVLRQEGVEPRWVTGYSSGVYAALAAAGGCTPEGGAELVQEAYAAMTACPFPVPYAMVAVIGLDVPALRRLLHDVEPEGWVSLINNRRQVIVSIPQAAVRPFEAACSREGALKVVPLPFERPYHVPPLARAGEALAGFLDSYPLSSPSVSLLAGPDPGFPGDRAAIARAVSGQLSQPVDWPLTVRRLTAAGAGIFVCLDPTGALARMVRWITRKAAVVEVRDSGDIESVRSMIAARRGGPPCP
jgi:malonyl CoA-acyl carrier protein transacylase